MAESERTPRPAGTPGPQGPGQQGGSSAGAPRAQEPAPERDLRHTAQELTAQGKDSVVEAAARSREVVRTWQTQLEHQVLEHPLQSLMIAAGLGLLVGLLQRR
jgi:ElaB/YqjD/DUF883 family membrane-anchored ribosome-binding protein